MSASGGPYGCHGRPQCAFPPLERHVVHVRVHQAGDLSVGTGPRANGPLRVHLDLRVGTATRLLFEREGGGIAREDQSARFVDCERLPGLPVLKGERASAFAQRMRMGKIRADYLP